MKKLIPFPGESAPAIEISADAALQGDRQLLLSFLLKGSMEELLIPALSNTGARADSLWKHTCMEAFIQEEGSAGYWEVNLSPSGEWNVYRFSDYRKDMMREEKVHALKIEARALSDTLSISCPIDYRALGLKGETHVGLTSVIEDRAGRLSYWAIKHAGEVPDFHRRDSFLLSTRVG